MNRKHLLRAMIVCFAVAAIGVILLLSGCGGEGGMSGGGAVIYDGPIYGDFITLYEQVKQCKGYTGEAKPWITIYETSFDCTGITAGGCYLNSEIGMVGPTYAVSKDHNNLIDTEGALFSHELTHMFQQYMGQPFDEKDPCGQIKLPGFQI